MNELQLMEELKMYPPRFIVHVSGEASSGSTVAAVHFRGTAAAEELWSEIHLPYNGKLCMMSHSLLETLLNIIFCCFELHWAVV